MFSLLFVSRNFFIYLLNSSVACWLFRNVLFNLRVFVFLIVFFLVIDTQSHSVVVEKMFDMISIFLNLLRLNL